MGMYVSIQTYGDTSYQSGLEISKEELLRSPTVAQVPTPGQIADSHPLIYSGTGLPGGAKGSRRGVSSLILADVLRGPQKPSKGAALTATIMT